MKPHELNAALRSHKAAGDISTAAVAAIREGLAGIVNRKIAALPHGLTPATESARDLNPRDLLHAAVTDTRTAVTRSVVVIDTLGGLYAVVFSVATSEKQSDDVNLYRGVHFTGDLLEALAHVNVFLGSTEEIDMPTGKIDGYRWIGGTGPEGTGRYRWAGGTDAYAKGPDAGEVAGYRETQGEDRASFYVMRLSGAMGVALAHVYMAAHCGEL